MIDLTDEKDLYLANFEQFEKKQAKRDPEWLQKIRQAAAARFADLGFPTTHDEEWRFTSVAPLTKIPFKHVDTPPQYGLGNTLDRFRIRNWPGYLLVFVNGHFSEQLSSLQGLHEGVQLGNLA